ncbi:MAG TPA: lactate permease LctP family transporter [Anaeromyxobacteraceae bacterium]
MSWNMVTDPLGHVALSALLAAVPLFFLFWALAIRRMKGHRTAVLAAALGVGVAIAGFGMPAKLALLATFDGMLFGLWPVAWIVVTAVFLYNLSVKTGQFEVLKNSLASITDDRRLQALLIAFSFGAFLEGAAGFGAPVAISGAMLVGLGFEPLYAAGICLIANTAPVAFGAIGIPIVVAGQVSGVDTMAISQMVGRTLPFVSIAIPFYLVVLMAGFRRGFEVWPAALVSGGSFAVAQWASSNFIGPLLPDIIASIASIVSLTLFLRVWHPKQSWRFKGEAASHGKERLRYSGGQVFRAWTPFILLSVFVGAWGIKSVKVALDHYALFKWAVPGLDGMVVRGGKPLAAAFSFSALSAAGTSILLTALVCLPVMKASPKVALQVFGQTLKALRFPILTISFILGFAYIMNFSGMAYALGNAFAATGKAFPLVAPFLGWLGVLMTGSDTSTNALFGKLQEVTATKLGVDPVITVAANTSGGVCGKMISPQSLAVATAAVGLVGKEPDIFRFTLKHSILLTSVIAVLVYLQSNVLHFMVPIYARGAAAAAAVAPSLREGLLALAVTALVVTLVAVMAVVLGRERPADRAELRKVA